MASDQLQTILSDVFGFRDLRPGQEKAIEALMAGRNVLAVMPTGSGKSICYQLPALALRGLTIVVSPLLALMRDQVEALRLNGVQAAAINSDFSRETNVATWRAVQAGDIRLLYLSPERLMTPRMLKALGRLDVSLIAIDEAHCISQWGHSFRPEYEALADLPASFPGIPVIALTATADAATRDDIRQKIFKGDVVSVITGFDRPNLNLSVQTKDNWKQQVLDFVGEHNGASGIVYALSRRKTEEVAGLLRQHGHDARAFHAGMDADAKAAVQSRFMTEPGQIVVATIAFGMGIDKPDIRYVLHIDLPASPEGYYQEIGRAGRDGDPADTLLLYGLDDIRMRRTFIENESNSAERKRQDHKRLDALLAYCDAPQCRRRTLLRYFGEDIPSACGNCDVCLNPADTVDGTEEARMVLTTVCRTGERFGAAHIIAILRGRSNERVAKFGHDDLPDFGVGAARSQREWQNIIRQMVATGLLDIDVSGYGGLQPTDAGRALLRDDGIFRYRPQRQEKEHSGRHRSSSSAPAADLDVADAELLEKLRALRRDLAKARGVPAYVIFSDRSLVDMARRRPQSAAEFAEVFGVGEAKLARFGDAFVRLIGKNSAGA